MNDLRNILSIVFVLMVFAGSLVTAGEITIYKKSGEHVTGQLLSVRGDELLVSRLNHADNWELAKRPDAILRVPVADIESLKAEGHSKVLLGIVVGTVIGMTSGLITGMALDNESRGGGCVVTQDIRPFVAFAGLTAAGLLGGAITGAGLSTDDTLIRYPDADALKYLRDEARYKEQEPAFLQELK